MAAQQFYIVALLFCGAVSTVTVYSQSRKSCSTVYSSCKEAYLKNKCKNVNLPSGTYLINGGDGYEEVYCDMQGYFCGGEGGWMRIAAHDMTITGSKCPSDLDKRNVGGKSLCGRNDGGCSSVKFNTNGISFNEVCGFVQAYQKGSTDAFHRGGSIDGPYLDGISITTGSPRKHVWSLAAGLSSERTDGYGCPCNSGNNKRSPSYVGSDYYCESGNPIVKIDIGKFYNEILWDGKGCTGKEKSCCDSQTLPYFKAKLPEASTSYIEMRLCHDQGSRDEDVLMESFEFFVR